MSRTLHYAFIFEVVIIRYDNMARDCERVHMIATRAEASPDGTLYALESACVSLCEAE